MKDTVLVSSSCSPEIQNILYIQRERESKCFIVIKEIEKSHDLPSANWRPKKASSVILVQTWRPANWESQCFKFYFKIKDLKEHLCLRACKDGYLSSRRELILPPSTFSFYSGPWWIIKCQATLLRAMFFPQSANSNANVF